MMTHVIEESKKAYSGTDVADTFLIFHDALSQWWEKGAQAWLKENYGHGNGNFHLRFLRAVGDTNKGTRYENGLVGDTPELCRGLDAHGFADLSLAVNHNCALSSVYAIDDPRRFHLGTPAQVWSTLTRCWEIAPAGARIVEDLTYLPEVLGKLIDADGKVVSDLILRHGRRYRSIKGERELKNKPRAAQRKGTLCMAEHHPDCDEARAILIAKAEEAAARRVYVIRARRRK
jgi:hypothetical protein